MKKFVWMAIVAWMAGTALGNLLQNPGFESELGSDNWSTTWGSFSVESWNNPPEGGLAAYIKGRWGGADNGGVIQSVSVNPGVELELKARFYVDNGWSANTKALKLEFFDSDGVLLRTFVDDLKKLKDGQWVMVSLRGRTPDDATRAQVVLEADGVSEEGVLGVDAFELIEVSSRR